MKTKRMDIDKEEGMMANKIMPTASKNIPILRRFRLDNFISARGDNPIPNNAPI